ncbi:hypothetical protein [Sphingorhabdus sp. Alg231-15]|uniref:hypothetical protein n=1 Tax=Sphingorhabdus sp. Alg231-15 TaxID=1922222 RepID=UPI000D551A87
MQDQSLHTKPDPRSATVQNRRISRIPAFTPAELRVRLDGWTPVRQAEFIGYLAETRCVQQAAARVGMSRESAYRLRSKPGAEEFVAAWDFILQGPASSDGAGKQKAKVTLEKLFQRIRVGRYRPMLHAGRYVGTLQQPYIQALLAAISRLDMVASPEDHWDDFAADHSSKKGSSL